MEPNVKKLTILLTPVCLAAAAVLMAAAPEAKTPARETKPAAKAAKSAAKKAAPKAEKKPAGPKLPAGTKVKYVGGSKADWLKKGAQGEIKSVYGKATVRYGVKFAGRSTVLAAKYVEKA